jgi:hypothetical protein
MQRRDSATPHKSFQGISGAGPGKFFFTAGNSPGGVLLKMKAPDFVAAGSFCHGSLDKKFD